jgi:NitT/TauT family transport system substrate-binding protein
VEFVSVSSAAERDQVIQAGQADAMINDLVSTMFYNSEETEILIVRYARTATEAYPQYRILASAESGITSVEDLKGQEIGVSEGTIIEYTTDRLLESEGLGAEEIVTIAVPRIPDRMALLNSSELAAGNLPDPLASLSIQSGARVILDDTSHPEYGHSVISFKKDFIDENPAAVEGFLAALEKAVDDINADKQQFASLLSDRQLVPEPILGTYDVPDFPGAAVPTDAQWQDTLEWATEKGYLEADLEYADSVDRSFLP